MSRIPTRQRGSDKEWHYIKRLNGMYCTIDNYTKILLEAMLFDLRQALLAKIIAAGKAARPDTCDDKIYSAYTQLMEYYRKAAELYDNSADVLVSPKLKNTMEGIYAILKSRLAIEPPEGESENPIFMEKKAIVKDGMAEFSNNCNKLVADFKLEHIWECQQCARKLFVSADQDIDYGAKGIELAETLTAIQQEHIHKQVLALYEETAELCLQKLTDIEARSPILQYNERIEQEQEILGAIVKIQLPLAEREKTCSPTEEGVVSVIVDCVREGYEALTQSLEAINEEIKESKKNHFDDGETEAVIDRLKSEDALRDILTATNYHGFVAVVKQELAETLRALEIELGIVAERESFSKSYLRCMYDVQRSLSSHREMAAEMIAVFEKILTLGKEKASTLDRCNELLIIQGINETIEIKIESLLENKLRFEEEMEAHLEQVKNEKPDIHPEDLNGLSLNVDSEIKEKVFTSYRQKMEKHIQSLREFITKKTTNFKKDTLLFEIITFEEIITYSVSRIRESQDTADYAAAIDYGWNELQAILLKNNIEAISPSPHEMFNGKEHEVLTTEKNPEYKKGEIIKLMNCGYRQDGAVIIRANVVAAV